MRDFCPKFKKLDTKKTDTIIIAELTVPWEDRMEQSNVLKEVRYSELTVDLIDKGYRVHFFAIEVGARGLVGRSSYTFLKEIGLPGRERNKVMERMSKAAETASHWLRTKRDSPRRVFIKQPMVGIEGLLSGRREVSSQVGAF